MTRNMLDRGLAEMPSQDRSSRVDVRADGGDCSGPDRHRESMARNTPIPVPSSRGDHVGQQDDADWDQEHDEVAVRRARRLLSRSDSGFHRLGDRLGKFKAWLAGERWVKRLAITVFVLMAIFAGGFGALWWRLGAGPVNLDMATPWLAAAIEENIGHDNTVEIGGTQIERAGRIRIAVRIRDVVVRDRDHAIVASAPKAEVRLSGMALLTGRLRAESLNLVDAELAVRITPDGQVTVSAGDNAKPIATGMASPVRPGSPRPSAAVPSETSPSAQSTPQLRGPQTGVAPAISDSRNNVSGLLAGLDWLDSLSLTGLDGQNLNEIGLKNG
ncbi:MAG: hypothetical protein JSS22_12305, partial [Proteobacteria bacterium]|nr:hypothetical protein [Pseudomonadota bacterium]